jgi:hypothetical protein
MWQMAFVSSCTATLAVVGFYMGSTIHGPAAAALIPTLAGGAGGFGIGCAALDALRRWRAAPPQPERGAAASPAQ